MRTVKRSNIYIPLCFYLYRLPIHTRLIPVQFTFHYVSTYTERIQEAGKSSIHLHSTMFLLIRISDSLCPSCIADLHSTMFLLIQIEIATPPWQFTGFTFHYVSTYTLRLPLRLASWIHLHSTMFLLILTSTGRFLLYFPSNLHSTMFLLIRDCRHRDYGCSVAFTFHYVSTYTGITRTMWLPVMEFTFHYVSTYTNTRKNTQKRVIDLHSTMFLLIPTITWFRPEVCSTGQTLCFYLYQLLPVALSRRHKFTFHYVSTYTGFRSFSLSEF